MKENIINTAKKVGITVTGLDVNNMQQDKFEQALSCMTEVKQISSESANKTPEKISILSLNTNAIVPMAPNSLTKSARGKHRFGTAAYWKYIYDQSQIIHQEIYSKCFQLEKIPEVLTVDRVKLKGMSKIQTICASNVHGSMEA